MGKPVKTYHVDASYGDKAGVGLDILNGAYLAPGLLSYSLSSILNGDSIAFAEYHLPAYQFHMFRQLRLLELRQSVGAPFGVRFSKVSALSRYWIFLGTMVHQTNLVTPWLQRAKSMILSLAFASCNEGIEVFTTLNRCFFNVSMIVTPASLVGDDTSFA